MTVKLSSHFTGYTDGNKTVECGGNSIKELLENMDQKYPGIRFRIVNEQDQVRQHISIFVNAEKHNTLTKPLTPVDTIHIIGALSGG